MKLTAEGLAAAMPVWWASYLQNAARWAVFAPSWMPVGLRRLPLRCGVFLADRKARQFPANDSVESRGPACGAGGLGVQTPQGNGGKPLAPTRNAHQVVGKGVER